MFLKWRSDDVQFKRMTKWSNLACDRLKACVLFNSQHGKTWTMIFVGFLKKTVNHHRRTEQDGRYARPRRWRRRRVLREREKEEQKKKRRAQTKAVTKMCRAQRQSSTVICDRVSPNGGQWSSKKRRDEKKKLIEDSKTFWWMNVFCLNRRSTEIRIKEKISRVKVEMKSRKWEITD